MKSAYCFLIFIVAVFLSSGYGQKSIHPDSIPPALKYEFQNRYPGVQKVVWYFENDRYYADFMFSGTAILAQYEKNGRWLSAESSLYFDQLPRTIQRYVTTNYPTHKFDRAKYIEQRSEMPFYLVETTDNEEKRFIYFDKDGFFLRMTDQESRDLKTGAITEEKGRKPVFSRELPTAINSYILINYPDFRIEQSYLVNDEEWKNTYYIILSSHLIREKIQLWFDFRGNLQKVIDPRQQAQADNTQTQRSRRQQVQVERKPLPETAIPQPVKDAFAKKIKKYEQLQWDTIHDKYVATYIDPLKNQKCTTIFKRSGEIVENRIELNPKTLNQTILRYIEQNYPYLTIHYAANLTTADRKRYIYVMIYDKKWLNNPMVYHELFFSQSGKLEKEIYADYIDPYDSFDKQDYDNRQQRFFNYLEQDTLIANEEGYKRISRKELPSKAIQHIRTNYPEHRISEAFIMVDDFTGETVYWVTLKKEGLRTITKLVFNFKGDLLNKEEY